MMRGGGLAALLILALPTPVMARAMAPARRDASELVLRHRIKHHMPYAQARAIIVAQGWRPLPGACGITADRRLCRRYPEIDYCALDQGQPCGFSFGKGRRCLEIGTLGDVPGGYGSDANIVEFFFHNRPCHNHPWEPDY